LAHFLGETSKLKNFLRLNHLHIKGSPKFYAKQASSQSSRRSFTFAYFCTLGTHLDTNIKGLTDRKEKKCCHFSYFPLLLIMVFCYQNCSEQLREEIVLVIEKGFCKIPGFSGFQPRISNVLRPLEQFIQTVKVQNNFW